MTAAGPRIERRAFDGVEVYPVARDDSGRHLVWATTDLALKWVAAQADDVGRGVPSIYDDPFTYFGPTHGALGSHVAEHCEVAPRPIRELYVVGPGDNPDPDFRTEMCWPIQRTPL